MRKKWSLLLALVFTMSIFLAACGGDSSEEAEGSGGDSGGEGLAEEQVLDVNIKTEPPTLHPGKASDTTSQAVLMQIFEGLTRMKDGEPVEAMASDIKISDDLMTYTFTIREGATWSNGDPVVAKDFAYAWKWVLSPDSPDTDFAYQLYPVKNAEKAKKGEIPVDKVGVTAKDKDTLVVELEQPTPYFLQLTAMFTFYPVNHKVVKGKDSWATDATENYVTNGPFTLEKWEHQNQIVLKKNPDYWDAENVHLEKINMYMIEDPTTELNMYKSGKLDWAGSPTGKLPTSAIPSLKKSGELTIEPKAGIYYYSFNTAKKPFNNVNIRKAFALSINRKAIVENITKGGQQPAMALVPSAVWKENEEGYFKDNNVEKAKEYLQKGLEELGLEELPAVKLSYNTDEGHAAIAQAIQDMWKKHLGVEVKLNNQEWNVYLDTMDKGNYEVGRMGWVAPFKDPINFLQIFKTTGGNNYTHWESEEYAKLLEKSKSITDEAKRKEVLRKAEKVFMDAMPVSPIYFYTSVYLHKDYVKDVSINGLGKVQYKWGYIAEH